MDFEKKINNARQGFEESFQEAVFYKKQTEDDVHLKLLLDLVCSKKGDAILDLGTGSGYIAFALASRQENCKIAGMDIVADTLERNRKEGQNRKYENLEFVLYDGRTYPFADQSFHTIITRYALHHFPDLEDSFREMYRVLKKGGRLIISDPTPNENDATGFVDKFMRMKRDGHVQFYSFAEYNRMLEAAGFQFVSNHNTEIRFPRKSPRDYVDLLLQYDKEILDGYEIAIKGDEIWIKENVLNMIYQK